MQLFPWSLPGSPCSCDCFLPPGILVKSFLLSMGVLCGDRDEVCGPPSYIFRCVGTLDAGGPTERMLLASCVCICLCSPTPYTLCSEQASAGPPPSFPEPRPQWMGMICVRRMRIDSVSPCAPVSQTLGSRLWVLGGREPPSTEVY